MKILFICHRLPHPAIADTFRALHSIKYLRKIYNHEIYLICFQEEGYYNEELNEYCSFFETVDIPQYKSNKMIIHSIFNYIFGLLSLQNKNIYDFYFSCSMKRKIDLLLKKHYFDAILLDSPIMGYYVLNTNTPKIVEVVDSIGILNNGLILEKTITRRIIKYLIYLTYKDISKCYGKFDILVTATEDERNKILLYSHNKNILVCPFGVEIDTTYNTIDEDYPSIIFIGNLSSPFNQESVRNIYNNIYPIIKKLYPKLKFYILGKDPSREIIDLAKDNSVLVTGYVDDVRPYLRRASVVVLPIHGYGIKTRILEAMSTGRAVITSSQAVKWLNAKNWVEIIIADSLDEYISAIDLLLKDKTLRNEIGANARQLVQEQYSWETMIRWLNDVISDLANE